MIQPKKIKKAVDKIANNTAQIQSGIEDFRNELKKITSELKKENKRKNDGANG